MSEALTFVSSPMGLSVAGVIVAAAIVIWDWRLALAALFVAQAVVGAATVALAQAPVEWVLIQTAVMGLSCIILGMSASQTMTSSPTGRQSGSWWLRLMAVLFLYGGWRLLNIDVNLPEIDGNVAQLFGWLAACSLLILGLGTSPLFGGVAFLMWIIPIQAFVAIVLEIPSLVALVGILELLLALACSYLLVAERIPAKREQMALTDVAFPVSLPTPGQLTGIGSMTESIGSKVKRRLTDRAKGASEISGSEVSTSDVVDNDSSRVSTGDAVESMKDTHGTSQDGS